MANFIKNLLLLLRDRRWEILWPYFKLQILRPTQAKIFNFDVKVYRSIQLIHQFEANFIQQEYFFKSPSRDPVIFDCGANFGDTILYFKWLYPKARITAFEASPETFRLLTQNVKLNSLSNVKLHNVALSSRDGSVKIYEDPKNLGSGLESLYKSSYQGRRKLATPAVVPAKRLSTFIKSRVDFLKIDIEGAEKEVLPELARSGKLKFVRQMAIEYHHHLTANDDQLSKILSLLESAGFSYHLSTPLKPPITGYQFQDILIYSLNQTF